MDNLMWKSRVLDGQLAALANIDFKKKLAKVREHRERQAQERDANKKED